MRYVAAIDGWGGILCMYSCGALVISAVIYIAVYSVAAGYLLWSLESVCKVLHMCTGALLMNLKAY